MFGDLSLIWREEIIVGDLFADLWILCLVLIAGEGDFLVQLNLIEGCFGVVGVLGLLLLKVAPIKFCLWAGLVT